MGKNWDYSELAHDAKMNGGPEKYLELIRNHSMREGELQGKAEGKTELLIAEGIAAGIGLLGYAGYKAFTTIKERREKEALKKQEPQVKQAEETLISNIKQADIESTQDNSIEDEQEEE